MRRSLTERLLDEELALILEETREMDGVSARREGTDLLVQFERGRDGAPGLFRLRCDRFDMAPPSLSMLDVESLEELPLERWTTGVPHSLHPVTQLPFVCLQGLAEYHTHPSHLDDSWDRYRYRYRPPQTVRRLLEKAGVSR